MAPKLQITTLELYVKKLSIRILNGDGLYKLKKYIWGTYELRVQIIFSVTLQALEETW